MIPPPFPRGFSLIEAAIVLGVIGLVISGVWVAATEVNRRIRHAAALEALTLTLQTFPEVAKRMANDYNGVSTFDYLPLVKKMPGRYRKWSNYFTDGRTIFWGSVINGDYTYCDDGCYTAIAGISMRIIFNVPKGNPVGTNVQRPDVNLCTALSRLLLKPSSHYVDGGAPNLTWYRHTGGGAQSGSVVDQWSFNEARPTTDELMTTCETATHMSVINLTP